ncbi:NADase-type glycan-binding domain-containing protein [Streptomyces sp. NPDC001177]
MTTTQNCAECGTRAEPGQSFCDACGAVLSWTDRVGAPGASAGRAGASAGGSDAPAAAAGGTGAASGDGPEGAGRTGSADGPAAAPVHATSAAHASSPASATASGAPAGAGPAWDAFSRADGGAGPARTQRDLLGAATEPVPAPESATAAVADAGESATPTAGTVPAPVTTPAVDDTAPTEPVPATAPATGDTDALSDRARRLLVPVADPEPAPAGSPSVAPVLPGRPVAQRPQAVRAPGEELGTDGGTPCPWCATRNRPDRHYCARCAMPMAGEGPTPGRLPWWRRLLGFGNRETPWAGERPRLRRTFDRVLTWLGAALVLTLLIVLVVNIPKGVQATRDHFAKRAPVAPDSVKASHSYPGHKPELAFDKLNNTWWGPGVSESGQGQWIEARFAEPTRLLDLIITPGVSTRPDQLAQSALPHRVEARVTTADGRTTTRELTLDQGAGGQRRAFRVGEVTAVRFTIESAYQTSASKQVSIAEIEFFGPSNASSS